jgi:serine/threonine protein kinase
MKSLLKGAQDAFLQEARLFSLLNHWNLAEMLAVCTSSTPNMMVMEFVDGMTLSEYFLYLRANNLEGSLVADDMTDIITQLADVMSYLSRNGVVHRDLCARYFCHVSVIVDGY